MRVVLLFLLSAALLLGETFKLYLKDGGYHLVREYQVQGDRVRFYSTERDEWEEMPVSLVDLPKTEREHKARLDEAQSEARAEDEEEKAEREQQREIAAIPMDPGAYYKTDKDVQSVPQADFQVVTDKKRRALQIASPVPLIPGKAAVVIKGEHSKFVINDPRPSFYLRLAKEERFGIVRVTPHKNTRIVENISIVPVAKQAIEERKQMDTFDQQIGDGLFRVWPEKPLTPGEYALIEFTDKEDMDEVELLVWDFAYQPAGK
ncbi:MAG TPA: hypothetical protein VKX25_00350 [Bryobacteraceae bacterium]|nr:hypothetical protein [Bryobacteraceae bacterium]